MIEEGQKAPDLSLPGIERGEPAMYDMHRAVDAGRTVLLWFVPTTFLPAGTAELCAIRDAGWSDVEDLAVWALTMDSIYAAAAYADEYALPMAVLGDAGGVADAYGVCYDEWEGHFRVPKRAVVLVDPDWTVSHAWATDDAFGAVDPSPVDRVAGPLTARFDVEAATVDYSAFLE